MHQIPIIFLVKHDKKTSQRIELIYWNWLINSKKPHFLTRDKQRKGKKQHNHQDYTLSYWQANSLDHVIHFIRLHTFPSACRWTFLGNLQTQPYLGDCVCISHLLCIVESALFSTLASGCSHELGIWGVASQRRAQQILFGSHDPGIDFAALLL